MVYGSHSIVMAKPSLKASPIGIETASQALVAAGLMKKDLVALVGCSRQPITNFFSGKAIAQPLFMSICDRLKLNWQAIADLPDLPTPPLPVSNLPSASKSISTTVNPTPSVKPDGVGNGDDIKAVVETLRAWGRASVQEQCGTIRILDMLHPIDIIELYTNVNVLEKLTSHRLLALETLLQSVETNQSDEAENLEHLGFNPIPELGIPAIEAVQTYQKLVILGKPGAGKTTFLKYLAIQCSRGIFYGDRLPLFITLKDFAEADGTPTLLEYIDQRDQYRYAPITASTEPEWLSHQRLRLLQTGHALILLDGLDEVRADDYPRVIKELRTFTQTFWQNTMIITSRVAAWDYTFEKFTEVEIADFDHSQIRDFCEKWFKQKPIRVDQFLRYLKTHPRVKQLVSSPLLLVLVCLAFEESGTLPRSRSELYKEGIDALLRKWDAKRGIQRDQIYQKLSHQQKEDLLSYMALLTFEKKDYFFPKTIAEEYITDYIRHLSHITDDPEALQLDSEAMLKSIEAQHGLLVEQAKGIYAFAHLSFLEYFAARELVFHRPSRQDSMVSLAQQVSNKRWREVVLLSTEMLRDASLLLLPMKQVVDQVLASSAKLQAFLADVHDRAKSVEFSFCQPAAVRAFYFDIDFDIDENRVLALTLDQNTNILVCASFLTRMLKGVTLAGAIAIAQDYDAHCQDASAKIVSAPSANAVMVIAINLALSTQYAKKLEPDKYQLLRQLISQIEDHAPTEDIDDHDTIKEVADQARDAAKTRYHIGDPKRWQFSSEDTQQLRTYYYANRVLVDCLKSYGCRIAPDVRQHIEATLLCPIASES